MEDLATQLNQFLNSKEGMQQLQNAAAALGLVGRENTSQAPSAASEQIQGQTPQPAQGGLGQLLGALTGGGEDSKTPSNPGTPIDVGNIANLLGKLGLGSNQSQTEQNSGTPGLPNLDFNMILQVQKAMARFAQGNKNVDLLLSLKPHFSQTRQKKVDDAVKIMQLIHLLPMLKETGLFGWGGEKK